MGKFNDQFQILKTFDPRKVKNSYDLVSSYISSKRKKQSFHRGMPASISIEPTTSCNLRCPECPSGLRSFTRPTGMMEVELFEGILDELHPWLNYLIFYFQGEPYLHKGLTRMIEMASSKNIYTATSTNAHYLDDLNAEDTVRSGLHRLIVSIDGSSQDTYESYRVGGKLDKVIQGVQNVIRWKKKLRSATPHIIFQFLVVRPNEHQIDDIRKLGRELGVDDVKFKTAQIYDYKYGSDLIPTIDKYSRYKLNGDGTWHIKNPLDNHCWKMWHSAVITWDGKVVPCCFDKDADHRMGDLSKMSFREIWEGEAYDHFRNQVVQSRSKIEMCQNCTEGTRVWA